MNGRRKAARKKISRRTEEIYLQKTIENLPSIRRARSADTGFGML
jgi:hypothetical protein